MSPYNPPVENQLFLLYDVFGGAGLPDRETGTAILEEAARLAAEVLAPLNEQGDRHGAVLKEGKVATAPGFKEAYAQYAAAGWNGIVFPEEYGGQGLPWALAFAVQEMWQGANMAFGLCPLLNQGAVEAILAHGSDAQKNFYLPKMISGKWTGTMNLTEGGAGSDLGLLNTRAVLQSDGTYRIFGQKIFITYGEHDFTDNIIHLVLARIDGAPPDVKGISLFIVPKFLEDGTRNDVQCTGLEHKLGIHGSPTCTMQYGDQGGAVGSLVGEPHQGLKYMFTMMNNARLSVGLQGVAIAEAAFQKAKSYAQERYQGKAFDGAARVTIDRHPDVKRMLLTMESKIEAGRALAFYAAFMLDRAVAGDAQARTAVDILTPLVKSWCTDMACDVASLGVQIHGGMGYIEEAGAARFYRDARILPIYEGTNGIQAADLVFRKILRDSGASAQSFIAALEKETRPAASLQLYIEQLKSATEFIAGLGNDSNRAAAAATPYLNGFALVVGAMLLARVAATAKPEGSKQNFYDFFTDNILPQANACFTAARQGSNF